MSSTPPHSPCSPVYGPVPLQARSPGTPIYSSSSSEPGGEASQEIKACVAIHFHGNKPETDQEALAIAQRLQQEFEQTEGAGGITCRAVVEVAIHADTKTKMMDVWHELSAQMGEAFARGGYQYALREFKGIWKASDGNEVLLDLPVSGP